MAFPRQWKHSVDIKRVLKNGEHSLSAKGELVADILRPLGFFEDEIEELVDAGHEGDVEWFDNVLSAIYDIADDERVWLGV